MMEYIKVFGVKLDNLSYKLFQSRLDNILRSNKQKSKVYKINTEFLKRALDNPKFADLLNQSTINLVDGRGVLWTARYLNLPISKNKVLRAIQAVLQMIYSGALIVFNPNYIKKPIQEAIPGIEAFHLIIQAAIKNKSKVFLFGASKKTLQLAIDNLSYEYPNLKIAGHLDGYSYQRSNGIDPVKEINKTKAKVLIVALGSPKQEHWINDNLDKLNNIRLAIGEGGTLDRVANERCCAPRVVNRIGLEWLWRLFTNKNLTGNKRSRIGRVWNSVPVYITKVVKWKIDNGSIN